VSKAGFGIGALLKGMREGGAVAPLAVIANAVRDALVGVEINETPITRGWVRAALLRASTTAGWHEGGR